MEQRREGRPVLVIFNYIYEAEGFAEALQRQGITCNSSIADAEPEGIRASDRKERPKWAARKRDDI